MNKKKILIVFGTRPEAIKMAPLIKELEKESTHFECKVVVTAQHREMLDQVLNVFSIKPDYDLDIMKTNQSLSNITSHVLKEMENILKLEKPDIVLVHGDTTTSFSASLAAYYQNIPIGHVEAGLRTYDKNLPFPEEGNRQMIDNISDVFFAPTKETAQNLINEKKPNQSIFITGNTAIDAILHTKELNITDTVIQNLSTDYRWILLTMHRRENQGKPMIEVFKAIKKIIERNKNVAFVFPVHMSPSVQKVVNDELKGYNKRIYLVEPLKVDVFHHVLNKVEIVLSDSGGLQEEAPALNKPVLVLRDKTERPEGIKAGTIKLVGTNEAKIVKAVEKLLCDSTLYEKMAKAENPYGDGLASERIVSALKKYFE